MWKAELNLSRWSEPWPTNLQGDIDHVPKKADGLEHMQSKTVRGKK